ncbi:hypothetical protein WICPIJ_005685 [Wickerhamomyces pijperi]|uniref:Uncharacterized protein n=1 Tax=Wickerhamomyces pijperi TaxID=599730 RepID=A0A9P8Q3L6_WICPI|nr:hypothetical protein WICPIJ_005685 [Wickerhamomyces pijperi]
MFQSRNRVRSDSFATTSNNSGYDGDESILSSTFSVSSPASPNSIASAGKKSVSTKISSSGSFKSLFSLRRQSQSGDKSNTFSVKHTNKAQGFIFGTEQSGKSSVLKYMNKTKGSSKLDLGPVVNYDYNIPLSHYRSMLYLEEHCEFLVFVFDCSILSVDYLYRVNILLNGLIEEYRSIRALKNDRADQKNELKLLIYMNKLDLTEYNVTSELIERTLTLRKYSDINSLILPCDAAQNRGISEGVNWLLT